MMVDAKFASLLENLKLQDPWLPPNTWESIPCESGLRSRSKSNQPLSHLSTLSESSLVRLAMNATQGVKSSLIIVQKLSSILCSDPADRTFLQIPNLWNRASSTHSLGNILKSIGCTGSLVFLLHEFVDYFTNMNGDSSSGPSGDNSDACRRQVRQEDRVREEEFPPFSLVNQAFTVAVGKVLEGYICGLDTIHAAAVLRRSSKDVDLPAAGCLKTVVHSEITLLEYYLHTKELWTQVEALASICNLQKWAPCFSDTAFEDLITEATSEFSNFYRGGNLLTFLYAQLQVADPAHCTLLKFLFLQTFEPYCGFIRSWIFKAEIHDPYKEFVVENMECLPPKSHNADFPLSSIRVRDGVPVPGFLKDFLVPLVRAGQQLQVLLKLLELCIHFAAAEHSSGDFLPCWSGFSSSSLSYSSPLTFSKDTIEAIVLARECYYKRMNEKIESLLRSLEVRYQQVAMHASVRSFENSEGTLDKLGQLMSDEDFTIHPTEDMRSPNMNTDNLGSDVSSAVDESSLLEDMNDPSECSSLNGSEEHLESNQLSGWPYPIVGQENHLSALSFLKSTTLNSSAQNFCYHDKSGTSFHGIYDKMDDVDHLVKSFYEEMTSSQMFNPLNPGNSSCSCKFSFECRESLTDSYSTMGHMLQNSFDNDRTVEQKVTEKHLGSLRYFSSDTLSEDHPVNNMLASNLYAFQPQNVGHQCNIPSINPLSMNLMLTRNALLHRMGINGEKYKADHEQPLPYFDFSTVEDPCKVYMDKLPINSRCRTVSSLPPDINASTYGNMNNEFGEIGHGKESILVEVPKYCFDASLDLMDQKNDALTVESGGSTWERLLGSIRKTVNYDATPKQSLLSTFEIPLDIIIDKCLLQEIMLQYPYLNDCSDRLINHFKYGTLYFTSSLLLFLFIIRRFNYYEFTMHTISMMNFNSAPFSFIIVFDYLSTLSFSVNGSTLNTTSISICQTSGRQRSYKGF